MQDEFTQETEAGVVPAADPMAAAPAAEPAADPAPPPPAMAKIEEFVESWWSAHVPGTQLAMFTPALNIAHAAKEDLKKRLVALFEGVK